MLQYKTILKLTQSIIDSISNVAVASFVDLKKFFLRETIKVEVRNPTKDVSVSGEVAVTNTKPITDAVKGVGLAIRGLKNETKKNKEVKVSNLNDMKFPSFPKFPLFPKEFRVSNPQKEVKVTNIKEFTDAVERVSEFVAKIKYDPRIEVKASDVKVPAPIVNVPEQKPPVVNVEAPDLSDITKIITFLNKLGAKNPLPVRLSDGKKFYRALEEMAEIYAGSSFSAFQSSGGQDARALLNRNNEVQVTSNDTWSLNDVHIVPGGVYTYLGEETVDGRWKMVQVQKVGDYNIMKYATVRNNSSAADYDYDEAWDNHDSLLYGRVSEAL